MSASLISTPKQKGDLYLASSLCDGLEDNDLKQVTTLLRNKEADPNVLMPLHGITPFHLVIGNDSLAFAEEVTKLFLRHGGNPNVKSVDGMTPVHVAAAWGRTKILELLLANGGDALCLDTDSCSPFHYALHGGHYEALSILSKYCITDETDEDEKPKFKRELGKVLVNNGEVLAEYMLSDDSSFESSSKTSFSTDNNCNDKSNTSDYAGDKGSSDTASLNNNFVTVRRNQKKRLAQDQRKYSDNNYEENSFDFKRETAEEEINLINEIISQLSNSVTSDIDINSASFQNYEDECMVSCKTSSPKRIQMTMIFNRPTKHNELSTSEKLTTRRQSSTLQVIKQHNHLPHLRNNKILVNNLKKTSIISEKNVFPKTSSDSTSKKAITSNVTSTKSRTPIRENLSNVNKWIDETIISKSPNLVIKERAHEKKKYFKTPVIEKKTSVFSTKVSKSPAVTPSKLRTRSPNTFKNQHTPISRIPKPKKYFITPANLKTSMKTLRATPIRTVIPNKRKVDSTKKTSTTEKPKRLTPLNRTFSKSENSTPSFSAGTQKSMKSDLCKENLRSVVKRLDEHTYNSDEKDASLNLETFSTNESKKSNHKSGSTSEKKCNRLQSAYELISGVGILDSGITSKSDSKSESVSNKDDEIPSIREAELDLNRAILDSLSNAESSAEKFKTKNNDAYNSLHCESGSMLSDSNDSFLSVGKINDNLNIDNGTNRWKEAYVRPSVSPDSDIISLKDNSFTSCKKLDSDAYLSVDEEYKYEDPEEGVVFLERRLCVTPSCGSSDMNTSYYSCSTTKSEPLPQELFLLDNVTLRERLKNLGENPGPITDTTHRLYLKRLHRLQSQGRRPIHQKSTANNYSRHSVNLDREKELIKSSLLSIDWIKNLDDYDAIEQKVFLEFATPNPSRKWREGTSKSSFNYLLLDPRITKDLPRRAGDLTLTEKWETFLSAIFYVGKGKRSRPYAHLYDAFKIWVGHKQKNINNVKIQRILDIWNEGKGVVVLHVFHNTIPVEAFTREAMMIEVLGTQKLGNCKFGDYYGVVATWKSKNKCELGRYLLFKAMQILLLEGERQIFPDNL